MRLIAFPLLAVFIALLAAPVTAVAQPEPAPTPTEKPEKTTQKPNGKTNGKKAEKLSEADLKVMAHLHHVNQMEIDMGKLAEKKASAPAVKKFAASLVKEHEQIDKNLMAMAKKRGATIPKDVPETDAQKTAMKDQMDKMAKLKTMKGPEFDNAFLTMMVEGHDAEVARLDTAIPQTTDPEAKELLTNARSIIQKHGDEARELQKNMPTS